MIVVRAFVVALLLRATVVAQDAVVPPSDGAPKVTTRVLHIRDEPFPTTDVGLTSAGMSADGRRIVVGIKSVGPSHLDTFEGQPGWPDEYKRGPDHPTAYVYDLDTNESTELKPTIDGKVWQLIGPPAISPDGRFVAAACTPEATYSNENVGRDSTVAIVDTLGDKSRVLDLKSLDVKAPVAWYFGAPALARDAASLAIPTTPDFGNGVHHGWTMLWNRDAGTIQAAAHDDAYLSTGYPGLSDDGRFLVVGAEGAYGDDYPNMGLLIDTRSAQKTVVSAWPDGTVMTNSVAWSCAISGNGSTVAFVSRPGPHSPASDDALTSICVHDVSSGTRRVVPVVHDRDAHIGGSRCSLSASGQYVAYLVSKDSPYLQQRVCVRDFKTARAAVLDAGRSLSYWILCTDPPALSADGRQAVFVRLVRDDKGSGDSERTEVVFADIEW